MSLPLSPPLAPQLARPRRGLPEGDGWSFEPKWDGFRAIAFVDDDGVRLQSRGGKSLERYFPELRFPSEPCVLDGEIVIASDDGLLQFNALQQRIHPAASRIERLAAETPARFVSFDLLAQGERSLLDVPFADRRDARARCAARHEGAIELTPSVTDATDAERWLREAEGVIAKELDAPYRPGQRTGMLKIKRVRTIDCVVVGWRPGKAPDTVGSLILGLYDGEGKLHVVGHSSGFSAREKKELVGRLAPHETGERGSGDPSRWDSGRELEWIELRAELVVEITFDHTSGGRIRHGAKVQRWREDKAPGECRLEQLDN
jgi:ATP-dependent DNA ligase